MIPGILVVLLIVIIPILLYSKLNKSRDEETPLEILKKRYAKGEITKEEFDKISKDL